MILEQKAGDEPVAIPTRLNGCYPNPFNTGSTISFSVAKDNSPVSIAIYNIKGQKVCALLSDELSKGNHNIIWNGKDNRGNKVSSGIYLLQMQSNSYHDCIRMFLTK
jgi:flagellar hook assembly protein FlgD